jgi:hypothetical protein
MAKLKGEASDVADNVVKELQIMQVAPGGLLPLVDTC